MQPVLTYFAPLCAAKAPKQNDKWDLDHFLFPHFSPGQVLYSILRPTGLVAALIYLKRVESRGPRRFLTYIHNFRRINKTRRLSLPSTPLTVERSVYMKRIHPSVEFLISRPLVFHGFLFRFAFSFYLRSLPERTDPHAWMGKRGARFKTWTWSLQESSWGTRRGANFRDKFIMLHYICPINHVINLTLSLRRNPTFFLVLSQGQGPKPYQTIQSEHIHINCTANTNTYVHLVLGCHWQIGMCQTTCHDEHCMWLDLTKESFWIFFFDLVGCDG